MKNTILKVLAKLGFFGLTLAALTVAVVPAAHAVNLGDAQLAEADETAVAGYAKGGADVINAVNLFFTGKGQSGSVAASTGAYITISATAMTFYQPFGTVDASVGTAGVITYSSTLASNTMGSLCDYINGLGVSYRCILQGAQRSDPPKILTTQTSTDLTRNLAAAGGLSVTYTTTTFVSLGINPAVGRRVVLKQVVVNDVGGVGDNGLQIYGQLRKCGAVASANAIDAYGAACNDSYNVWTSSIASNAAVTTPSSNALPRWIEFAQGAHVVVRVGNVGGTAVETGSNYVSASWDER